MLCPLFKEECKEDDCAWYHYEKCSLVSISESLEDVRDNLGTIANKIS